MPKDAETAGVPGDKGAGPYRWADVKARLVRDGKLTQEQIDANQREIAEEVRRALK